MAIPDRTPLPQPTTPAAYKAKADARNTAALGYGYPPKVTP